MPLALRQEAGARGLLHAEEGVAVDVVGQVHVGDAAAEVVHQGGGSAEVAGADLREVA